MKKLLHVIEHVKILSQTTFNTKTKYLMIMMIKTYPGLITGKETNREQKQ